MESQDAGPAMKTGFEVIRLFLGIALSGTEKALQRILHIGDAVTADKRLPLSAQLVEHGLALVHERVPAIRHREPGASRVTRIEVSEHVPALFEERHSLGRRLLCHGGAPPHFRHRYGTRDDGPEREVMRGTHTGISSLREPRRCFFCHESEPAEKQQRQIRTISRHPSIISTTWLFNQFKYDNLVVYSLWSPRSRP